MKDKRIVLDGSNLKAADLQLLLNNSRVSIDIAETAKRRIKKGKAFVDKQLETNQIVYGINTGFGPMASHIIGREQLVSLQENLIFSHAVGMGESIPSSFVLAGMVVRLNTLVKGYSGVSLALVERLCFFINHRIIPVVPEHGAVGTSGDLVQLAHIALGLLGKGEVWFEEKKWPAEEVVKKMKLSPFVLRPREGLALINGTAIMTGIAALLWHEMGRILEAAVKLGGIGLELVGAFEDSLEKKLHELRPHPGQQVVAKRLRALLSTSSRLRNREALADKESGKNVHLIAEDVQQVYSLRCIAQILGPVLDAWMAAGQTIEIELNAVTDNPIVDWQREQFLHGGNFHGEYIAAAVDQMKIALIKLSLLSERRINYFLNDRLNRIFPSFMNLKEPGLTLGLQGLQFVATSTAAQNQTLAFPHHIHSISTNGDNQDVVSMGTDAALFLNKVVDNTYIILAIEGITVLQGMDFLGKDGFSITAQSLWKEGRKILPVIREDRIIAGELAHLLGWFKQSALFDPGFGKEARK